MQYQTTTQELIEGFFQTAETLARSASLAQQLLGLHTHLTNLERLISAAYVRLGWRGFIRPFLRRAALWQKCEAVVASLSLEGFASQSVTVERFSVLRQVANALKHSMHPFVNDVPLLLVWARDASVALFEHEFKVQMPASAFGGRSLAMELEIDFDAAIELLRDGVTASLRPYLTDDEFELFEGLHGLFLGGGATSVGLRSVRTSDEFALLGLTGFVEVVSEFEDGSDDDRRVTIARTALRVLADVKGFAATEGGAVRMALPDVDLGEYSDADLALRSARTILERCSTPPAA